MALGVVAESRGIAAEACALEVAAESVSRRSGAKRPTSELAERLCPRGIEVVKSQAFDTAVGALIILNCITMGIGAETLIGRAEGWKDFVSICEHLFTLCFVVELMVRAFVFGWRTFLPFVGCPWNFLDAVIVFVTGVLMVWILPLFRIESNSALGVISVLRICRLVRLVRVVAKVKMFHEVWKLVAGLAESMRMLFWTVMVICVITYIFAIVGVVLISSELQSHIDSSEGTVDPELVELMGLFDGIFNTMQTLIQVLLLDSVHGFLRPLMQYVGWSWLFVYAYVSMAVIVLLNLVTAVIVDNAMKNSQKDEQHALADKENDKRRLLDQFRSLFESMDADGDGQLTWPEFEGAFEVPEVATKLKMLDFEPESCRELFHLLDRGDGSLSLEEFFGGMSSMDGNATAKDSFKLLKVTRVLQQSLQQLAYDVQEDHEQLLHHTPGCTAISRLGSLRARSHQNCDASAVTSPARSRGGGMSARSRGDPPAGSPRSPFCERECNVGHDDGLSPALGQLRRLPRPLAAVTRECSVGSEGDVSPAMKATRRKLLGLATAGSDGLTDSATLARVNEVAEQVVLCNSKVDSLVDSVSDLRSGFACSVADLQASMAKVLQRLDGSQQV